MLKRLILEVLIVVLICSVVTNGRGRNKRADIGAMIKNLLNKIMGTETTTTTPTSNATITSLGNSSVLTNGTINNVTTDNASLAQNITNTSINNGIIPAPGIPINGTANAGTTKKPNISSTSKKTTTPALSPSTTMWPATTGTPSARTSTMSFPWSTKAREPEICYINPYLQKFCSVPATLSGVSFWDLYSTMFSDTVLDALLVGCRKGEWCLRVSFFKSYRQSVL